jgi:F-type H+-transporting ATPase subunit gamma
MPSSMEIGKRMTAFHLVEDVISAMRAYAGVTVRRTEEVVSNIREYEKNMLSALADLLNHYGSGRVEQRAKGKRILVAFGSSVGLCGPYNEKVSEAISGTFVDGDTLFVVGRKLKVSLDQRNIPYEGYIDSVISVNGIQAALKETLSQIMNLYRKEEYYNLTFIFAFVSENKATISVERILPPDTGNSTLSRMPPMTYLSPFEILDNILEEFIYISLYRCYVESLRSENWYRLRSMEGASEILKKRLSELGSLQRYIGQEEITEEMIEILGSGMFFRS